MRHTSMRLMIERGGFVKGQETQDMVEVELAMTTTDQFDSKAQWMRAGVNPEHGTKSIKIIQMMWQMKQYLFIPIQLRI